MDYINTHSNEERLSNIYVNNTLEPNNESSNLEGYLNLLDNNFTFNQKDINTFNLIDKQTKPNSNEEKDHKNKDMNDTFQIQTLSKTDEYQKENSEKPKKRCGRKRKNDVRETEHGKFSDDNVRRKVKHLVLKYVMIFINQKIDNIYGGKIGSGTCKKQLKLLNHEQKKNASIEFNQKFLHKKLGEIFSESLSGRYTNFLLTHNERLISKLINEKDEVKKNILQIYLMLHF